jgi:hypothetical protein
MSSSNKRRYCEYCHKKRKYAMFESDNVSSCIKCTPPIRDDGPTVDLDERHQNLLRQLRSFQKESQPWRLIWHHFSEEEIAAICSDINSITHTKPVGIIFDNRKKR